MTSSDLIVLLPWLAFDAALAIVFLRLLRNSAIVGPPGISLTDSSLVGASRLPSCGIGSSVAVVAAGAWSTIRSWYRHEYGRNGRRRDASRHPLQPAPRGA